MATLRDPNDCAREIARGLRILALYASDPDTHCDRAKEAEELLANGIAGLVIYFAVRGARV